MDGNAEPNTSSGDQAIWGDLPAVAPTTSSAQELSGRRVVRRRRSRRRGRSRLIVGLLAIAAAVGAAFAGCHPTGTPLVDVAYTAAAAAVVTLAASHASRSTLLLLCTVAVVMSRGWLLMPATAALLTAFGAVFPRRSHRRLNALIGAGVVQVVLRWPPVGFHGSTALVAVAALLPVLLSAWRGQRRAVRRRIAVAAGTLFGLVVVFSVPVALGGLLARSPVNRGMSAARDALHEFTSSSASASSAESELDTASAAFGAADARAGAWWTVAGRLVPVVAQQRQAMAIATSAGHALTAAAAQEAGQLDLQGLRYRHGQINLAAIEAAGPPLEALDGQLAEAQARLAKAPASWLVGPIASRLDHLRTELTQARNAADLAVAAVKAGPAILGADGTRRYFVAFETPAETRGLGGLIGAYAEVDVDNGRLTLARAGPIGQLDTALSKANPQLTGVPEYMSRYGAFHPEDHIQDVTYAPDLPTVAKVITELCAQAGLGSIDGVLVLDPQALGALLGVTGPITVAGLPEPLTSANAAEILLRQQYADLPDLGGNTVRHDLLQNALEEAFAKLATGSLPGPGRIAQLLSPEVHQGRLLFWSNHPADQPFLERLGLEGAFPQPGRQSDVLAVTSANAANNKIDAYLHEQVEDTVRYDPGDGHVDASVTITLTNAAPSAGLPPEVIGSYRGSGLPLGTNYMWLSLYSPLSLTDATDNGRVIGFSPGTAELGVTAYSAFLTIPAESTDTLAVSLVGAIAPGTQYRVAARLQPLAYSPELSVSVQPASGWTLADGQVPTWAAGDDVVQEHAWQFRHG